MIAIVVRSSIRALRFTLYALLAVNVATTIYTLLEIRALRRDLANPDFGLFL